MTDNEIIRDFEFCINTRGSNCIGCSFEFYGTGCCSKLYNKVLSLLKEQQSEIERLKLQLAVKDKKIEILYGIAGAIRKQSIEKFTEKLKAEYEGYDETYHQIFYSSLVKAIDKIADEMKGKEEGK